MYFAHEEIVVKSGLLDAVWSAFQNPGIAIPSITLAAIGLMIGSYWLLKRYTSWNFPKVNERKK